MTEALHADDSDAPLGAEASAAPDRATVGWLDGLRPRRLAPVVDPSASVRPEWMRDRDGIQQTSAQWARRTWYRTKRVAFNAIPVTVLLVLYSPRGLSRVSVKVGAYLYDADTARLRHSHAEKDEVGDYAKTAKIRKDNLRARWAAAGVLFAVVSGPFLAFLAPIVYATVLAITALVLAVMALPKAGLVEAAASLLFVAVPTWSVSMWLTSYLPALPSWPFIVVAASVVLALGWHGRPDRGIVRVDRSQYAGEAQKPTADVIVNALLSTSIPGLTEKTQGDIRIIAPGLSRSKRGHMIDLELPGGVTASSVMDKREEFAGALRRKLGTVWPSRGPSHPGHLRVFIADRPMNEAIQGRWKVAEGKQLDIFESIPEFTDQQGDWVSITFAYNHFVVGGAPGFGKSVCLRQLAISAAFDPRVKIVCLDGKGNGDLRPLRLVAHGFYEGDEEDEIADQLRAVHGIRQEMRRRNRFLRDLPAEENPQNKVTSALVDRYPDLSPIVLLIDEVQVYTEHDDPEIKKAFIATFVDLVKRGRSAGIIPVFCTQKPDAKALPSAIADNCSIRICFRVHGWRSNDQVLGSEMHSTGVKATLFAVTDKGVAYLRGEAAEAQIVQTVQGESRKGIDQVEAEQLCAQARAIRKGLGLLTGYAAGESAAEEELQVDFLVDCRSVMDEKNQRRIHLGPLTDALCELRPKTWGNLDVDSVGAMLRDAGISVRQVKVDGRNTSGVRREDLDVAATSDVEAAEGGADDLSDDEDWER